MARLIDGDALEEKGVEFSDTNVYVPIEAVWNAPTIDPVHAAGGCYCRECVYLQQDTHGLWCFRDYENPLKLDGFCSYGIRREENGE